MLFRSTKLVCSFEAKSCDAFTIEGFKTFSHAKSVYKQPGKIPVTKLAGFMPPYGDASEKSIKQKVRL